MYMHISTYIYICIMCVRIWRYRYRCCLPTPAWTLLSKFLCKTTQVSAVAADVGVDLDLAVDIDKERDTNVDTDVDILR